jgi:hypothetical protein
MKGYLLLLITLPFITLTIVAIISFLNRTFYTKSFFISIIIPFIVVFLKVNSKAKEIVKKHYGISSKEMMWNSFEVLEVIRNHEKKNLLKYLKKKYINLNKNDIKRLSDEMINESENLKVKFPLIPSIFAALFISLWNNFFSWIYRYENVKDFELATKIFLMSSLILLTIIVLFMMIKSVLDTILDDIFNGDYKSMKKLTDLLKEVYDDMERENK